MKKNLSGTAFTTFIELLEHGTILDNPSVGFDEICAASGADPEVMDAWLVDNFGAGGDEIVGRYRNCR